MNIVDLNSRAPPSHRRTGLNRELSHRAKEDQRVDWNQYKAGNWKSRKLTKEDRLCPAGPMSAGKPGLGFVRLRRKALESEFPRLKSLSVPALRQLCVPFWFRSVDQLTLLFSSGDESFTQVRWG